MKRLLPLLALTLIAAGSVPIKNAKFQGAATFDIGSSIDFAHATVLNLTAIGLPPFTGHAGQWLTTDGNVALWSVLPTLDALPAPVADVSLAGFKLINQGTPINPTDGANKSYVDALLSGLQYKTPVVAATAGTNITLSGPQTIDGVAVVAGNRVLVKDQSTASQNGIYVVASGSWTRSTDANSQAGLLLATVRVTSGTVNLGSQWTCTTPAPITVGVTSLTFTQTGIALTGFPQYNVSGTWTQPQTMPVIDSGSMVTDVRAYGALLDGTTDDTTALRAAITAARNSKSTHRVYIPAGVTLLITDTITIDGTSGDPVMIEGGGSGWGLQPSNFTPSIKPTETIILWGGPPPVAPDVVERPMILFIRCNGGHGLRNIRLDNANNNAHGLAIDRCTYGTYENVSVVGMAFAVANSFGVKVWSSDDLLNTSYNAFRNLYIEGNYGDGTTSNQGRCLWLHGTTDNPANITLYANACLNTFVNTTTFSSGSRSGIELGAADRNTFINTVALLSPSHSSADAIRCNYLNGQNNNSPSKNVFMYVSAVPFHNTTGAEDNFNDGNIAIGFDTVNGTGLNFPVTESGFLKRITDEGDLQGGFSGVYRLAGSTVIYWDNGDVQMSTLTAATNFTFSTPRPGQKLTLLVNCNGFTCTFPTTVSVVDGYQYDGTPRPPEIIPVYWAGGGPPSPTGFCRFEFIFQRSIGNTPFIMAYGVVGGR